MRARKNAMNLIRTFIKDCAELFEMNEHERLSYVFVASCLLLVCLLRFKEDKTHWREEPFSLVKTDEVVAKQIAPPVKKRIEPFNLNTVDVEGLVELGFSEDQANAIVRYRLKCNGFSSIGQFARLRVVSEVMVEKLTPYIIINKPSRPMGQYYNAKPKSRRWDFDQHCLDLNNASEHDLRKIYGVGKVYAKRIVAYRKLLGGFSDILQIKDVYGVDSALFRTICADADIGDKPPHLRMVRKCLFAKEKVHPYLRGKLGRKIIEYFDVSGDDSVFVDELWEAKVLTVKECNKLKLCFR